MSAARYTLTRADRFGVAIPAVMAAALAVCMVTGAGAYAAPAVSHTATLPADRDAFVTEDSPRWDCHIDGNRLCGPFHGPTR